MKDTYNLHQRPLIDSICPFGLQCVLFVNFCQFILLYLLVIGKDMESDYIIPDHCLSFKFIFYLQVLMQTVLQRILRTVSVYLNQYIYQEDDAPVLKCLQ